MSNGKSGMNETGPVANHSPAWSTAFAELWTTAAMAVQGRTTDSSGDLSRLDVNLEAIKVGSLGVTIVQTGSLLASSFALREHARLGHQTAMCCCRRHATRRMQSIESHTSLASW